MTHTMGHSDGKDSLSAVGKAASLVGIAVALLLLVLLNGGTSPETLRTPTMVVSAFGAVAFLFGAYHLIWG